MPLRDPDPDVIFDLQKVFAQCYANGGYASLIDYRKPPRALLSAKEAAWVKWLLKIKWTRRRVQSRKNKGGANSDI